MNFVCMWTDLNRYGNTWTTTTNDSVWLAVAMAWTRISVCFLFSALKYVCVLVWCEHPLLYTIMHTYLIRMHYING